MKLNTRRPEQKPAVPLLSKKKYRQKVKKVSVDAFQIVLNIRHKLLELYCLQFDMTGRVIAVCWRCLTCEVITLPNSATDVAWAMRIFKVFVTNRSRWFSSFTFTTPDQLQAACSKFHENNCLSPGKSRSFE